MISAIHWLLPIALSITSLWNFNEDPYPEISLPDGFKAEMIYSPSEHGQGSWVSLTSDDKGRLLASDQYGRIYRITPGAGNPKIDSINLPIGSAQGMLVAPEGLYVSVNARAGEDREGSGVYLLQDTNNDDTYDTYKKLLHLDGEGEHGPHALIKGPDESIYLIGGNHTLPPAGATTIMHPGWREDRLFPALLDPRGHASEIEPPGGWIARSSDKGKTWELMANGFRNAYDIAFNKNGDLFTYDSDMEWDLGTPWYRPTRVCHVIPGAEFGWRTGSGKWADYYPDNLPGILDVGQGSPTGIVFGYGAKFPASYQESLFISDWSFGTIYKVDLSNNGASYSGSKEVFLSGSPLAISDVVIHTDGNMYFTTGGRRGTSLLYKVTYEGNESTSGISASPNLTDDQKLLHKISAGELSNDELIAQLGNADRFISFAAMVKLMNSPSGAWWDLVLTSDNPQIQVLGSLAALNQQDPENVFAVLNATDNTNFDDQEWLNLLRAYAVLFSRSGTSTMPSNLPSYPTGNPSIDRELCELLVYLGDSKVIEPTLDMMLAYQETIEAELTPTEILERSDQYGPAIAAMHENRPAEQALALALSLSYLKDGWTDETRKKYFTWFHLALTKSGGMSYKGFVEKVRLQALDNVPEDERARLAEISGAAVLRPQLMAANVRPPEGPGRNWQLTEARREISELSGRSFKRGKELYQATLCASCHQMKGEGGNIGPDLTQAGNRFSGTDLINSIILPSMAISDQYNATLYTLKDGSTRMGRSVGVRNDSVYILMNPFSVDETGIALSDIESEQPSPVSMMPAGLINSLNPDELRDLFAYLRAGGDENHELYSRNSGED